MLNKNFDRETLAAIITQTVTQAVAAAIAGLEQAAPPTRESATINAIQFSQETN